jgi:hypothetical protein
VSRLAGPGPVTSPAIGESETEEIGPDAPKERATRSVSAAVLVVLVVLVVVAGGLAGLEWRRNTQLTHQRNEQRAVAGTASGLGEALLSYNSANLAVSRNRVLALSTPTFAATYDQDFSQALSGTITALGASAAAQVRDVYVADVARDSAKAIVVMDFKTTSTAGTRQVLGTNLQMDLVRQGGSWKVDAVTVISASSETQTPAAGGS